MVRKQVLSPGYGSLPVPSSWRVSLSPFILFFEEFLPNVPHPHPPSSIFHLFNRIFHLLPLPSIPVMKRVQSDCETNRDERGAHTCIPILVYHRLQSGTCISFSRVNSISWHINQSVLFYKQRHRRCSQLCQHTHRQEDVF